MRVLWLALQLVVLRELVGAEKCALSEDDAFQLLFDYERCTRIEERSRAECESAAAEFGAEKGGAECGGKTARREARRSFLRRFHRLMKEQRKRRRSARRLGACSPIHNQATIDTINEERRKSRQCLDESPGRAHDFACHTNFKASLCL